MSFEITDRRIAVIGAGRSGRAALRLLHALGADVRLLEKSPEAMPEDFASWLEASGMPMGCQIKNACETVGRDRVMFGIDSPFHHPTVEIQRVLTCGLDEAGLEDVFYNNAAKFMGWL